MKKQTAAKLKELLDNEKIVFSDSGTDIVVNYDLTNEELRELVEIEYGQTQQSVVELFTVLCKKVVKLAYEKTKV